MLILNLTSRELTLSNMHKKQAILMYLILFAFFDSKFCTIEIVKKWLIMRMKKKQFVLGTDTHMHAWRLLMGWYHKFWMDNLSFVMELKSIRVNVKTNYFEYWVDFYILLLFNHSLTHLQFVHVVQLISNLISQYKARILCVFTCPMQSIESLLDKFTYEVKLEIIIQMETIYSGLHLYKSERCNRIICFETLNSCYKWPKLMYRDRLTYFWNQSKLVFTYVHGLELHTILCH